MEHPSEMPIPRLHPHGTCESRWRIGSRMGVCLIGIVLAGLGASPGASLYRAHLPRLLFTPSDLSGLYEKVRDGGPDDSAYVYIQYLVGSVYPKRGEPGFFTQDHLISALPNIGLAAFLESPRDTSAIQMGRRFTLFIADDQEPD